MFTSRPIYVPLSAVAAAFPLPTPSSGLPLLSGLVLTAGCSSNVFADRLFILNPPKSPFRKLSVNQKPLPFAKYCL
ncbi:MAG: hypothetical protein WCL14_12970 [Bacteroidota bacterium]